VGTQLRLLTAPAPEPPAEASVADGERSGSRPTRKATPGERRSIVRISGRRRRAGRKGVAAARQALESAMLLEAG